jgi:hypothetical protein
MARSLADGRSRNAVSAARRFSALLRRSPAVVDSLPRHPDRLAGVVAGVAGIGGRFR